MTMSVWKKLGQVFGIGKASVSNLPPFPGTEIGDGCGLLVKSEALTELERRIAEAFRTTFMDHVRTRVRVVAPALSNSAYDWALLELRRFFLLTIICKDQVPMYSETSDKIWHEMLLFTREYDSFCHSIAGRFIHHEPYVATFELDGLSRIIERVKFELLYSTLFQLYPGNQQLLGAFGKKRFPKEQIMQLEQMDARTLCEEWLHPEEEASLDVANKLVDVIQRGIALARKDGEPWKKLSLQQEYASYLIAFSLSRALMQKKAANGDSGYYNYSYICADGKTTKHKSGSKNSDNDGSGAENTSEGSDSSCSSSNCSSCGGCSG